MTVLDRILSGEFVNPATVLGAVFYALVFLLLVWLGARSLGLTLKRLEGELLDRTTTAFLRRMGRTLIWLVALVLYAHLIPDLRSLGTALLTGVSVASILFGLAAQNAFGNLIAGLALLLYRPIQIGDRVQLTAPTGVETGEIKDLTLGYTLIKTQKNQDLIVPNSVMMSQVIIKSVA